MQQDKPDPIPLLPTVAGGNSITRKGVYVYGFESFQEYSVTYLHLCHRSTSYRRGHHRIMTTAKAASLLFHTMICLMVWILVLPSEDD